MDFWERWIERELFEIGKWINFEFIYGKSEDILIVGLMISLFLIVKVYV